MCIECSNHYDTDSEESTTLLPSALQSHLQASPKSATAATSTSETTQKEAETGSGATNTKVLSFTSTIAMANQVVTTVASSTDSEPAGYTGTKRARDETETIDNADTIIIEEEKAAAQPTKKKRATNYSVFRVTVGRPTEGYLHQNVFTISKKLLCKSSELLRETVERIRATGGPAVLTLRDVDLAAFESYHLWLRTSCTLTGEQEELTGGDDSDWAFFRKLINSYLLGVALKDAEYRAAVIRCMIDSMLPDSEVLRSLPSATLIHDLYKVTDDDSVLRKLLAVATASDSEQLRALQKDFLKYPRAFVMAVSVQSIKLVDSIEPYLLEEAREHWLEEFAINGTNT